MRYSGQSLSEYALPICLIALIGITGLKLVGDALVGQFGDLAEMTSGKPSKKVALKNPSSLIPSGLNPYPNIPGKNIRIDLGNNKSLNLSLADPALVAETAGGNGVTTNALASIDQMIAQLKELKPDDPSIPELIKLSEAGHRIKDIQKAVDEKMPPGGFPDLKAKYAFLTNPANNVMVNGQSMLLLDALRAMGNGSRFDYRSYEDYAAKYKPQMFPSTDFDSYSNATSGGLFDYGNNFIMFAFMSQLSKVQNIGALQNPDVKKLVNDLGRQIFTSGTQTVTVPSKDEMKTLIQTTRTSANDICSTGNGVTCQDHSV